MLQTAFGRVVRFNGVAADFSHPWMATLSNSGATFLKATINGVPATIGGVPVEGTEKKPAPELTWRKLKLSKDGIGYLCAEITCVSPADADKSGLAGKPKLAAWSILKVEMVQVADPDTEDGMPGQTISAEGTRRPLSGSRARYPVAMVQQRDDTSLALFQIAYFNLTHRVGLKADNRGAARHFFF